MKDRVLVMLEGKANDHRWHENPTLTGRLTISGNEEDDVPPGTLIRIREYAMSADDATEAAPSGSSFEHGTIDGYRIVYEHGPTSWGAYSDHVPGCFAIAQTREEVEQLMRGALALHLSDDE